MRRPIVLATSVAAAVAAAAHAGCYWPIPTCEETEETRELSLRDDDLQSDGSFRVDGRIYRSCAAFCADRPGVQSVLACERPSPTRITCEVEAVGCDQPTILRFSSGRRPEGLPPASRVPQTSGEWLAEVARLEAASVPAFERLARELAAHRAPETLVRRARRAMRDEIRHARVMRSLARVRGARPVEVDARALPIRDLAEIARENAIEGCVAETIGAIVATRQAAHARDASIRFALTRIAHDETRHAELAWDVLEWSLDRQTRRDREETLSALRRAATETTAASITLESPTIRDELGLPDRAAADAILGVARNLLWS